MSRPRLLDLFCCAGGAGMGYHLAGFDVVGIDSIPQPRYPFEFIRSDVFNLSRGFLAGFDAIHASPPCQFATTLRHAPNTKQHQNLIFPTQILIWSTGLPYVIENVEGAKEHLVAPTLLCGSMFGLGVNGHQLQRHRWFETSFQLTSPHVCDHREPVIGVYGGHVRCRSAKHGGRRTRDFEGCDKPALAREAMQMPWATMQQMSEAVPPAYTRFIGERLLDHLARRKPSNDQSHDAISNSARRAY